MEIARGLVFVDVIFRRRQATAGNTSAFAGYDPTFIASKMQNLGPKIG